MAILQGNRKTFEEGAIALESQALVDVDGSHVLLVDIEDDIADPTLVQFGYDSAGGRTAIAPPPVVRMGEDVAHRCHAVGRADQVSAGGGYQVTTDEDTVESAILQLGEVKGVASAQGIQLCQ